MRSQMDEETGVDPFDVGLSGPSANYLARPATHENRCRAFIESFHLAPTQVTVLGSDPQLQAVPTSAKGSSHLP